MVIGRAVEKCGVIRQTVKGQDAIGCQWKDGIEGRLRLAEWFGRLAPEASCSDAWGCGLGPVTALPGHAALSTAGI